eukprot:scaffold15108_cov180-Amphora_coffeaeformis.AAC.25
MPLLGIALLAICTLPPTTSSPPCTQGLQPLATAVCEYASICAEELGQSLRWRYVNVPPERLIVSRSREIVLMATEDINKNVKPNASEDYDEGCGFHGGLPL